MMTFVLTSSVVLFAAFAAGTQRRVPIDVEGDYVNEASGFVFPNEVGDFQRTGVTRYNELANNVSAGYSWRGGPTPTVVSVFVYAIPLVDGAPISLEQQFDLEERGVREAHPGTLDIATGEVTVLQNGEPVQGLMTEFIVPPSLGGWDTRVGSALYLFQHETWTVKVRATFPEHEAESGRAVARKFLDGFSWNGAIARDTEELLHNCTIQVSPSVVSGSQDVLGAWILYGKARVAWRTKNTLVPLFDGPEPATFEEEVNARELLLIGWKAVDGSGDPYIETLKRVNEASFLREYVHTYLVQNPEWLAYRAQRLDEFDAWRGERLADHEPITNVGLDCR